MAQLMTDVEQSIEDTQGRRGDQEERHRRVTRRKRGSQEENYEEGI